MSKDRKNEVFVIARYLHHLVSHWLWPAGAVIVLLIQAVGSRCQAQDQTIDFNRDVRRILSNNCFKCHGFDANKRQAGLRLDTRDGATAKLKSGRTAIAPGNIDLSELVRRITSDDPGVRMPPPSSNKTVTPSEIRTLRQWVIEGAPYQQHWAFVSPQRPVIPEVEHKRWPRNEIDYFVLAKLESLGLEPSPEADRETLIRRVSFDLTGLPPTSKEIDDFVKDQSPDAFEKVVDRSLASPRYGEHMARAWLDLARYADTNGFQHDQPRTQWRWRDWVIDAYNSNMSFDQFTIEQLAGDLLPNATPNQVLATGFNRNHLITIETGIIEEEYRTEYVMDRVTTTATTWLALTMGCARCHSHKFDPISQREFYQFFAYFNNVPERGIRAFDPRRKFPTAEQQTQLDALDAQIAEATAVASMGDDQAQTGIAELQEKRDRFWQSIPATMIMQEMSPPRQTFVLERGLYDHPLKDEPVSPGVPAILPPLPDDAPDNRLGLAQWLVRADHPLTARVAVNRYWQRLFGQGIVKTTEDFGVQTPWPSNLALLDWMATEFIRLEWDIKAIHKTIVMSATYRQASRITPPSLETDPDNQYLSRGSRMRLSAEEIRDNALFVSGLLVEKRGGPSVYPYHPEGLYQELNNRVEFMDVYKQGHGKDLYRRSIYTYWKRTVPPPTMAVFDAPEREYCVVSRSRTNTPLQALALLHDPQFIEAARALAQRMIQQGGDESPQRLAYGFRLATGRRADDAELRELAAALDKQRSAFVADPSKADVLLSIGESIRDESIDKVDHAAYTNVARIILNLDETMTKE